MKNVLYVLNNNICNYLIFENKKLKYFEIENDSLLTTIGDYLNDKITFESISILNKKNIVYYGKNYSIVIISINGLSTIEDKENIKGFINLDKKNFTNLDLKLLDIFFSHECRCNNLNKVNLNKEETDFTKKSTIFAIIIGILVTTFFIGNDKFNYLGISVPIIVLTIAVFGFISFGKVNKINYIGAYFLLLSILLSFTYAIYTNSLLRFINIILVPISLITGLFMLNYSDLDVNILDLRKRIIPNVTVNIFYHSNFNMIPKAFKNNSLSHIKDSKYRGYIKGVLISIPLLFILIFLLCSADKFFADVTNNFINFMTNSFFTFNLESFLLKIIIFSIVFAYMYYLFSSFKYNIISKDNKKSKTIDKDMVNTILILINTLYLVFTYIQVKYLFIKSNYTNFTPEEYSNYARSGFFQLLLVVILNLIIIIYFKNKVNNKLTSILNTLMTIISMNMSITSFYKMRLYIKNYGITHLRFMTSIFIIFILIVLALIAFSIWKKINLIKYCIIIGSIMYLLVNFCNMDRIIAKYNLASTGKDIDIEYLSNLSLDCYDIVLKAYNEGKISEYNFNHYLSQRKLSIKWYEYNYYNQKQM